MKDNTLILLVLGGVGLFFLSRQQGGGLFGPKDGKAIGPSVSPARQGGGYAPPQQSSTILQLPGNQNSDVANYVRAGVDLVGAVSNIWSTYKNTQAGTAPVLGYNNQTYVPAQADGTYYRLQGAPAGQGAGV